jgi:hypothetical protein
MCSSKIFYLKIGYGSPEKVSEVSRAYKFSNIVPITLAWKSKLGKFNGWSSRPSGCNSGPLKSKLSLSLG